MREIYWTTQDEQLLKKLAERYPRNWTLVADTFNFSRRATGSDKRTDWECKERYVSRFMGGRRERDTPHADGESSTTPARPQLQMQTRKRLASISNPPANGALTTPAPGTEVRRRRRHILVYDTVNKLRKKRELNQKANGERWNSLRCVWVKPDLVPLCQHRSVSPTHSRTTPTCSTIRCKDTLL